MFQFKELTTARGTIYVVVPVEQRNEYMGDGVRPCKSISAAEGDSGFPGSYCVVFHNGEEADVYDYVEVRYTR